MKECHGKRWKAYPKCESCPEIEECSFETLARLLQKKGVVVSSNYGVLIHADKQS